MWRLIEGFIIPYARSLCREPAARGISDVRGKSGDMSDRVSPSYLMERACSVPTQAGCHALSTVVMRRLPCRRYKPEYAIILSNRSLAAAVGARLLAVI